MSDQVLLALIPAVASTIAAILGVITIFISRKNSRDIEEAKKQLVETKTQVASTNETITVLEKNTNSIKDALVAATKGRGEAEGHATGLAEGLRQGREIAVQQAREVEYQRLAPPPPKPHAE